MKKLICMLLTLVTVLSLCACGKTEPADKDTADNGNKTPIQQTQKTEPTKKTEPTETTAPTEPAVPTEEEKEQLVKYIETVDNLNRHCKDLEKTPYSQSSMQYISDNYKTLLALDKSAIDIWANTEWLEKVYNANKESNPNFNHPADWDFNSIQRRFTALQNVKLTYTETKVDNLGNTGNTDTLSKWYYNADGSVRAMCGEMKAKKISLYSYYSRIEASKSHLYEYDAQGRVSKITYYHSEEFRAGDISTIRIFTYDDQGFLTEMTVQGNTTSNVYDYTCDDAGRIIKITWTDTYDKFEITNTYDSTGRLIREEKATLRTKDDTVTEREIMEYVYDNTGKLTEGTYTENRYQYGSTQNGFAWYLSNQTISKCTYEYDDQGNLVQETMIPGDAISYNGKGATTNTQKASSSKIIYTTTYGDYYVYNPSK